MSDNQDDNDPRYTIVIAGDDGNFYKLNKSEWQKNKVVDAAGLGVIKQLTDFGSYLAFIPPELAVGIGHICTVVNLKAILENNPKKKE